MTSQNSSISSLAEGPAVTVQSLGSGSSGNAFLIHAAGTSLLLDCGVGIRTVTRALRERDLRLDQLDAVLVTHEHSDHIRSLSYVTGKDIPIVSTAGTRRRANIPPPQWEQISPGRPLTFGSVTVWAITVSHDAAEPCGFLVEAAGTRASVFTDLGTWHERLADPIRASDLIVLESNHDHDMLWRGPYPAHLKRRVASPVGHLSNADCASSLATALRDTRNRPDIWLAHLSETNNDPMVAQRETVQALRAESLALNVTPLPRQSPGPVWMSAVSRNAPAWRPAPVLSDPTQLALDALL
ncbi:MAG: MBL fold metallo-hydrolase [Chloroflexia bacterium]|nr:MBL fold metallo-hydrolase [Chloroflexia bacterium]